MCVSKALLFTPNTKQKKKHSFIAPVCANQTQLMTSFSYSLSIFLSLDFIVRNQELCSKIENDYRLSGKVLEALVCDQFVVSTKSAHRSMIFRMHRMIWAGKEGEKIFDKKYLLTASNDWFISLLKRNSNHLTCASSILPTKNTIIQAYNLFSLHQRYHAGIACPRYPQISNDDIITMMSTNFRNKIDFDRYKFIPGGS